MITVQIGNSYSKISGLDVTQFKNLRKVLSYITDPKAAYFSGGFLRVKYLLDKRGSFPTGLLKRVYRHLEEQGVVYTTKDGRKRPESTPGMFKLNLKYTPHPFQTEATDKAVKSKRGGIVAVTGSGKSLIIALIASRFNVRTLVVVPTLEIKKQLISTLIECFGVNPNIVVENIDSASLKTLTNFDCLIIDECHHSAARSYQILNKTTWTGIYYRFFLTATFFRNQDNELLLFEGVAGQEIYRLTYKDAVNKGYIVPVEAYYYDIPKTKVEGFTWREVYYELVINNEYRNKLIRDILERLNFHKKSTLCLVKEIAHGERLSELTGFPFTSGKDDITRDYIRQFNDGKIKELIGTTGILGEGVDTKLAEYVVVAGLGKAKSAFMQQIGRGVRLYPGKESCKVMLFRDSSHKWTLSHFNTQKKILKEEYGVTICKL